MKLMNLAPGKAKRGTVLQRIDAQDFMNVAGPVLGALTHEQRQEPRYRRLLQAYAYCLTWQLPRTQSRPHVSAAYRQDLDVDSYNDQTWRETFMLSKEEFIVLHAYLDPIISERDEHDGTLTHTVRTANRMSVSTFKALGMATARLRSRATNYSLAEKEFGEQSTTFSSIVNEVLYRSANSLEPYFDLSVLHRNHDLVDKYTDAVHAHLEDEPAYQDFNVFGFIDGMAWAIANPTYGQEAAFDGHHRTHTLIQLAIRGPDGLCHGLWGPTEGRRHDAGIANDIDLNALLMRLSEVLGYLVRVYGDSAFTGLGDLINVLLQGARCQHHPRANRGDS